MKNRPASVRFYSKAAENLVAAWFQMHGLAVSHAAEGLSYDLLVDSGDGSVLRVQVKSSRQSTGRGSRAKFIVSVALSNAPGRQSRPYLPTDLDVFAVYREGDIYLIPMTDVVGRYAVTLTPSSSYYAGTVDPAPVAQLDSAAIS